MSALDTHIQNRNGIYYFRIAIPKSLAIRIGRKEYKCSLRTGNYRLALQKCRPLAYITSEFFREIDTMPIANEAIEEVAKVFFEKTLMLANAAHISARDLHNLPPTDNPSDPYGFIQLADKEYTELVNRYRACDCDEEDADTAKKLLEWRGLEYEPHMQMDNYIKQARLEAKRIEAAAMREDMDGMQARIPLFKNCHNAFADMNWPVGEFCGLEPYYINNHRPALPVIAMNEAINRYLDYLSANSVSADSVDMMRSHLDRMVDFLGDDRRLHTLNKAEHGVLLRDMILNLPKNFVQRYKNKGVSLHEVLAMPEYEKIGPKNRNFYWQAFNRFFRWCVADGYISCNPMEGISFKVHKGGKGSRLPFRKEQLDTLFSSAIYTGRKNTVRAIWERGDNIIRDGYYWVPLVGLYAGMRLGEILQLIHADIARDENGVWYFDINKDTEGKSLKTDGSQRKIPIHSHLIEAGFLDYWKSREAKCQKGKRLFEDNITYQDGDKIKNYSRQFAAYLKALEIKTPKHVFHSFRHNYVDQIRRMKGVTDEVLDALDGRSAGEERSRSTRTTYGTDFTPSDLKPFIEQIDYGLDRSVLSKL